MGTNDNDWAEWNYWITNIGVDMPYAYTIDLESSPLTVVSMQFGSGTYATPTTQYTFTGEATVIANATAIEETHYSVFGEITHSLTTGTHHNVYTYFNGNFTLDETTSISAVYGYFVESGNTKVAIYNATLSNVTGFPNNFPHPYALLTQSNATTVTPGYNYISLPTVELQAGTYFIAEKTDTTNIIASATTTSEYNCQYIGDDYSTPFNETITSVSGFMGSNSAWYVPSENYTETLYYFSHWDDDSTNATRSVSITDDVTLTAYYTTEAPTYVAVASWVSPLAQQYNSSSVAFEVSTVGSNDTGVALQIQLYNEGGAVYPENFTSATGTFTGLTNGIYTAAVYAVGDHGAADYEEVIFAVYVVSSTGEIFSIKGVPVGGIIKIKG